MGIDVTFKPTGPTSLLPAASAAIQLFPSGGGGVQPGVATVVRVRCTTAGYLTWGGANVAAAAAPVGGTPAANTLGFAVGQCEKIEVPPGAWFRNDAVGVFELTPGTGGN